MSKDVNFFDFVNDITFKKAYIWNSDNEKAYNPFMVNRALSQFPDTAFMANEMNMASHLDHKMQHDFYFNIVRKQKRFSKWTKHKTTDKIKVIMEAYNYSEREARHVESLLSDDDIKMLKQKLNKGGLK